MDSKILGEGFFGVKAFSSFLKDSFHFFGLFVKKLKSFLSLFCSQKSRLLWLGFSPESILILGKLFSQTKSAYL